MVFPGGITYQSYFGLEIDRNASSSGSHQGGYTYLRSLFFTIDLSSGLPLEDIHV